MVTGISNPFTASPACSCLECGRPAEAFWLKQDEQFRAYCFDHISDFVEYRDCHVWQGSTSWLAIFRDYEQTLWYGLTRSLPHHWSERHYPATTKARFIDLARAAHESMPPERQLMVGPFDEKVIHELPALRTLFDLVVV